MSRVMFMALVSVIFIFGVGKLSFAQHDHSGHEHGTEVAMSDVVSGEAVNVGNKICPVSEEKLGQGGMEPVGYEYEGKIYNFCCASCIEEFKKEPQKYIKKIEEGKL